MEESAQKQKQEITGFNVGTGMVILSVLMLALNSHSEQCQKGVRRMAFSIW